MVFRLFAGVFALAATISLMGCPTPPPHHDHPELEGDWQRRSPENAHQWEEEQIHFEEGESHDSGVVHYFGPFGGPNAMLDSKHEEVPLYPVFSGTYEIDESADPHTIDFNWTNYWPDEDEDTEFVPFTQKGIWEAMIDDHGDHSHDLLYINFGDSNTYPEDFLDETHGQEIKFERIDDHHDHD